MCVTEREQDEGTGAWLEAVLLVGAAEAQYSTSSLLAANQTHTHTDLT